MPRFDKWKFLQTRVLWVLIILLVPSFALFFMSSGGGYSGGAGSAAGTVFGRSIDMDQFQQEWRWVRSQWENRLGSSTEDLFPLITQSTWDRIIMIEEAKRQDIKVDDYELARAIHQTPTFQEEGQFIPDRYHRFVRALQMSSQTFERLLREDIRINRLLDSIRNTATLTESEVNEALLRANEKIRLSLMIYDPRSYLADVIVGITDEEINLTYKEESRRFEQPAKISFNYISLTSQEITINSSVTDEQIQVQYDLYPEQYNDDAGELKSLETVREEIRGQIIQSQINKQLVNLAIDLETSINAGLSFEELSDIYELPVKSVGPISEGTPFLPDGPEPSVLQVVYLLDQNIISDVIETDNGVYITTITKYEPSSVPPLDQVRGDVINFLAEKHARDKAQEAAQTQHSQLSEKLSFGMHFGEAAQLLDVEPLTPQPLMRTDPIPLIGSNPEIMEVIFSTSPETLTEVLPANRKYAVIYVHELIAPEQTKWPEEQRSEVYEQLLTSKQSETLSAWLTDLRTRANLESLLEPLSNSPFI